MSSKRHRTLIATLEDSPGVLTRVSSLFRRRGYNIVSLNVGRTLEPGMSRMTVVVDADEAQVELLRAHLAKLLCVFSVEDVTHERAVVKDLVLVKVAVGADRRPEILQLCQALEARVVDLGPRSVIVEYTGTPDETANLLAVLQSFDVQEVVQSGAVAMTRGSLGLLREHLAAQAS